MCNTKVELKDNGSIFQFKQRNRRKGLQNVLKLQEAVSEANGDFFE